MSRNLLISNFILFQIGWFACVLGGAFQVPLIASLVAAIVIGIHVMRAYEPAKEIRLIAVALVIGLLFESLLTFTGLSVFTSGVLAEGFAPHWMVMMWGLFATTLNVSMRWITGLHLVWVSVLGSILAPLSYLAGHRLDAIQFPDMTTALIAIAVGWGILFPLLALTAKRNNGYATVGTMTETTGSQANV